MLHYITYGNEENEKIMFLHGGGLDGYMWREVAMLLQDKFFCIVPDLPGHGGSVKNNQFTTKNCVKELNKFFDKFGEMNVVGLSMGGTITLRLLQTHHKQIKTAMISGTSSGFSRFTAFLLNTYYIQFRKPQSPVERTQMLIKLCNIPERFRESLIHSNSLITKKTSKQMYPMISETKLPKNNKIPFLIAVGGEEGERMISYTNKMVNEIPNSKGFIVPGGHHTWNYEDPQLFANTVRCWIEKQEIFQENREEESNA